MQALTIFILSLTVIFLLIAIAMIGGSFTTVLKKFVAQKVRAAILETENAHLNKEAAAYREAIKIQAEYRNRIMSGVRVIDLSGKDDHPLETLFSNEQFKLEACKQHVDSPHIFLTANFEVPEPLTVILQSIQGVDNVEKISPRQCMFELHDKVDRKQVAKLIAEKVKDFIA